MIDCERYSNHSSKDAMQDIDKRSVIGRMFMYLTLESSVTIGEKFSKILHSIKNQGENLFWKKMFDIIQSTLEHFLGIFGLFQINWEDSPWKQFPLDNDAEVVSLSHAKVYVRFCVVPWKGESEPNIKYCLGTAVGLVRRFTTIRNFGHNRRRTNGIRV